MPRASEPTATKVNSGLRRKLRNANATSETSRLIHHSTPLELKGYVRWAHGLSRPEPLRALAFRASPVSTRQAAGQVASFCDNVRKPTPFPVRPVLREG